MDKRSFEELKFNEKAIENIQNLDEESVDQLDLDFSFLTEKQVHQLFINLLSDRIISNWDTHKKQYGLDKNGDVIAFDKGNAFRSISLQGVPDNFSRKGTEKLDSLDLDKNHWIFSQKVMAGWDLHLINMSFFRQILQGKIKIDYDHPTLLSFFKTCKSTTKEKVQDLSKEFIKHIPKENRKEFIELIHNRIQKIKSNTLLFFKKN